MCFVIMLHELLIVLYLRNAEAAILWGRGGSTSRRFVYAFAFNRFCDRANLRDGKSGTVDLGPFFGGP